jgi:hypothetical protein
MIRSAALAAVFIAVALPALAHHGPGTFELAKSVSYPNATITRIEFINPHSWLYFETKEPDGTILKHRCEMRSAHTLRRSGWDPSMFKAGQQASIDASPDRADVASCYLNTIKFANGTRMDRYGQYVKAAGGEIKEVRGQVAPPDISKRAPRRPSGEPNISGDWAPEQVVMADPRGTGGGLVPLSTSPAARDVAAVGQVAVAVPHLRVRVSTAAPSSPSRERKRPPHSSATTTRASAVRRPASSSIGRSTDR